MTTLENVTIELKKMNIPTTGSYGQIPMITYRLIIDILHFGESALAKSTLGESIKRLALEMAKKDGRKCEICPITFKNILV